MFGVDNLFLWCQAEFSASLLKSLVSHNPSEIILLCWFAAQETCLSIINVENSYAASYFCGSHDTFFKTIWWVEFNLQKCFQHY